MSVIPRINRRAYRAPSVFVGNTISGIYLILRGVAGHGAIGYRTVIALNVEPIGTIVMTKKRRWER